MGVLGGCIAFEDDVGLFEIGLDADVGLGFGCTPFDVVGGAADVGLGFGCTPFDVVGGATVDGWIRFFFTSFVSV
ncbi:hypothetical protein CU097_015517 [Rhizopus azygosporus]|uniref:Uncharacterized protein n=1 Tax=Rhizopus azygosporus TaxID=86630 RepID=A0A367KB92_RHIAZ|nr:hypothetical protein CU097_015517 [Rhizopus azygosporus]